VFTVTNNGGDLLNTVNWIVTGPNGYQQNGTVGPIPAGGSQTINLGSVDPGTYTILVDTVVGQTTVVCVEPPNIIVTGVCVISDATFTATNNGGSTSAPLDYVVFGPNGYTQQGSFGTLDPGTSAQFTLNGLQPGQYTLFLTGDPGFAPVIVPCDETITPTPPPPPTETPVPTPEPSPTPYVCIPGSDSPGAGFELPPEGTSGGPGFPVINMNTPDYCLNQELPPPPWSPVDIGGAVCPDWLVYHTNMTGDWEIFRLGELPDEPGAEANLSQGVGDRVYDVSPARSPDSQWIAFTSSRDGNWELYIGRTNGSEQRRLTYNTTAIDNAPAWSPLGNLIAFQSNRNGNWDIFTFDLGSGAITQITSDLGNDIRPSWSPDATKLVYQSDREGFWQIYEYNLLTGVETKVSDGAGDDHDPLYSNDGTQILFRSYRDGENSVVYKMDADGQNVVRISDVNGNALNHIWSEDDSLIAYQSDLDGDYDIYVYEDATELTRLLTDNTINDVAPTWLCSAPTIVWTSSATEDPDVAGDNNIFSYNALPITDPPIDVKAQATQLTFDPEADQYPQNTPPIELASREGQLPGRARNR
jgi:Tol biopolymer transport system component